MKRMLLFLGLTIFTQSIFSADTSAKIAERVVQLTNAQRAQHGLPSLRPNFPAATQALEHSLNMSQGRTSVGHENFSLRTEKIRQEIPINGIGENVAYLKAAKGDIAERAINMWMNSPGHRENILGNYTDIGVGVATNSKGETYLTQIFINSGTSTSNITTRSSNLETRARTRPQLGRSNIRAVGGVTVEEITSP